MPPEIDPRALLVLAVALTIAALLAAGLVLLRIWRREPEWETVAENGEAEAVEQVGFSSGWLFRMADAVAAAAELVGPHLSGTLRDKAFELRDRARGRRAAEHAEVLRHELAAGPHGRPYDGEHRRGVPIHR